ncbi:MAG: hypothetical protein AAF705_18130, partial [Bacteroidota bacterium]
PFLNQDISVKNYSKNNWNTAVQGVYSFINCFHQLSRKEAEKYLNDIVKSNNPVVIVEGNNDSLWQIVGMTIFVPTTIILASPFVKPFRWSRFLFTYLIPVLPMITVIDGCIALLKLYNPQDLKILTKSIHTSDYDWQIGKNPNGRGGKIIYLKGLPK